MINFCSLLKHSSSIHCIPSIIIPLSAMALSKWRIITEEDPWKVSAFVSAIMELFLSLLLLLGASIASFTSCIVKTFGLEPPCTYIGCSHPLHVNSEGNQKSFAPGLKDHAAMEIGVHDCSDHRGGGKEHQCPCNDNSPGKRCNLSRHLCGQDIAYAHSNDKLKGGYPVLLSASSSSESIGGSGADDHCEIFQVSTDSEQKGKCKEMVMQREGNRCTWQGRSKRPRRRDFSHAYSNGKLNNPVFLPARSNPGHNGGFNAEDHGGLNAKEGKCEETYSEVKDSSVHDIVLVHHSEPFEGHTLVKDAHKVGSMVDTSNTEADRGLLSVRLCSESNSGLNAEFQVPANSTEHAGTDIKTEDFSDHHMVLASLVSKGHPTDANIVHASKGKQTYDVESSVECINKAGSMVSMFNTEINMGLLPCKELVDVCKTEQSNMDLLPCEDNQCIIQFGSIIARTCIKDGITNNTYGDSGRIDNRELVNRIGTGGSLQETGRNEPSTDIKILQFENNESDDAIAAKKSPDEPMPRNDMTMSTIKISTCTRTEDWGPSKPPLEGNKDEEEAVAEDEQEEGLDALKMALQAERSMLAELEAELENERNAAAVATSEAMAMISRLQEEKSAMQMEVAQLQRMSEEKAEYDEEAMAVLKEILVKRETENMVLEKEVELYREKLLAENAAEQNGVWLEEGRLSLESHSKRLSLIGREMESHSPLGATRRRFVPWIPQTGANIKLEEPYTVALCQNSNKRPRDFPASALEIPSEQSDDLNQMEGGLCGPHDTYQQVKKMGKCSSFTDDETLSAREGLWVPANHQELLGKEESMCGKPWRTQADGGQHLTSSSGKMRATSSLSESCGTQSKCSVRSEGGGEIDGGCGGLVPIHDVYEVHTVSNRSPPRVEERDPLEVFDGALTTNKELQPRMSRHITEFPPRFVPTKPVVSEDIPSTPSSMIQTAGWDIEKSFYTEDLSERHDSRSLSLVSREERRAELEEIKQLAARLKALEEDRTLLKETVESVKHKDAELSLLQEISRHLRELRLMSFTGVSEGALSEEASITSPSRIRPLKKRRYFSGLGQGQTMLQHQQSV